MYITSVTRKNSKDTMYCNENIKSINLSNFRATVTSYFLHDYMHMSKHVSLHQKIYKITTVVLFADLPRNFTYETLYRFQII